MYFCGDKRTSMRTYTDTLELFKDIQAGESAAYEYVFRTYYPRLRNFAARFIDDADDLDDIVQGCFVRLYEHRERITYISLSALLFTMVRNGCLNYLKRKALTSDYDISQFADSNDGERLYSIDFHNTADEPLLYEELAHEIQRVMDTLTPRCREVFSMSRFEGMKNREIAEKLGLSVKVVEKHITKALSEFRKHFRSSATPELYPLLLLWLYAM